MKRYRRRSCTAIPHAASTSAARKCGQKHLARIACGWMKRPLSIRSPEKIPHPLTLDEPGALHLPSPVMEPSRNGVRGPEHDEVAAPLDVGSFRRAGVRRVSAPGENW